MGGIFPWRAGNRFELLVDGPAFFPRMLQAIDQASAGVDLELYLVSSGACADALLDVLERAARRGVQVRCLFDAFGSQGLSVSDRQRLVRAGVVLRCYNPLHWRAGACPAGGSAGYGG